MTAPILLLAIFGATTLAAAVLAAKARSAVRVSHDADAVLYGVCALTILAATAVSSAATLGLFL